MRELKEFLGLLIGIGVLIILVVVVMASVAATSEYFFCREQINLNTQLEHEWLLWSGCRAQLPSGIWINAHDLSEYQKHLLLESVE